MNKIKKIFACAFIFLSMIICSCKNSLDYNQGLEENTPTEKKTGFKLVLPAKNNIRTVYYSVNDISKYVITVEKDDLKVAEKEGVPGQLLLNLQKRELIQFFLKALIQMEF